MTLSHWHRVAGSALVIVAALSLAACGAAHSGPQSSATTATVAKTPVSGYLSSIISGDRGSPDFVGFIELTRSGDHFTGTIQYASINCDNPAVSCWNTVYPGNGPIDGTDSGTSVTIGGNGVIGFCAAMQVKCSARISGTFEGADLVLATPCGIGCYHRGEPTVTRFMPASVTDYNRELAELQHFVSTDTTATTTTTTLTPTGPFPGPTSDGLEYICYDGTGTGGNGSGAIAAANDQGTCPSAQFPYPGEIQIGWGFVCIYIDNGEGSNPGTPYAVSIGSFTVSGDIGTFYGAYCPVGNGHASLSTAPPS